MKWKPLEELDEFFEHYVRPSTYDLAADVLEDENNIYVEMSTAGINPEALDIQTHDNVLRIRGTREEMHEKKGKHYSRKEIRRGRFEREISLPSTVDGTQAQADYFNGILKITLPKEKGKEPHRVKINVS
jgi:HSP20 family protein